MTTPVTLPAGVGCVSILLERGEWPAPVAPSTIALPDGSTLPFLGSIGAIRPNRYRHFLWIEGGILLTAELLNDVPHYRPKYMELLAHWEQHPDLWARLPATSAAPL